MSWIDALTRLAPTFVLALAGLGCARRARRLRFVTDRDLILGMRRPRAGGMRRIRGRDVAGLGSWTLAVATLPAAGAGWFLGGGPTAIASGLGAALALRAFRHRGAGPEKDAMDRRVQEFAEGIASAVRGGQSIAQAVEFAATEARHPLEDAARELLAARAVGAPFRPGLERFAERVGTDEIRLLALVLGIHHRAGGDVAAALDEVSGTIRHRLGLRRELRALTAQGRISGVVLGVLPVGFFLVMALTSHGQMQPVLRSVPGTAMVTAGFLLDGLALLWIRRLLRIEA